VGDDVVEDPWDPDALEDHGPLEASGDPLGEPVHVLPRDRWDPRQLLHGAQTLAGERETLVNQPRSAPPA